MILGVGISLPMMATLLYSGPIGESDPLSRTHSSFLTLDDNPPSLHGEEQFHHRRHWDEYEDFFYSRRVRRFNRRRGRAAWRYFDPFFTNDIYYVINTPYWSRWNNWYTPRPRAYVQTNFWLGGVNFNVGVYSSGWNPWGYDPWVYNDPWVNAWSYSQP